jgi:hypothetical protein
MEVSGRLYVRASTGERVQGHQHWKLGGPQSRLDDLEKWKITNLFRESNHDMLVVQTVRSLMSVPTELAPLCARTPD